MTNSVAPLEARWWMLENDSPRATVYGAIATSILNLHVKAELEPVLLEPVFEFYLVQPCCGYLVVGPRRSRKPCLRKFHDRPNTGESIFRLWDVKLEEEEEDLRRWVERLMAREVQLDPLLATLESELITSFVLTVDPEETAPTLVASPEKMLKKVGAFVYDYHRRKDS